MARTPVQLDFEAINSYLAGLQRDSLTNRIMRTIARSDSGKVYLNELARMLGNEPVDNLAVEILKAQDMDLINVQKGDQTQVVELTDKGKRLLIE